MSFKERIKALIPKPRFFIDIIMALLKPIKYFIFIIAIVASSLFLYSQFGPKYQYILVDNDSLRIHRYNVFNGKHERCFINEHRVKSTHLKEFDKSKNSETIFCYESYEFTEEDLFAANYLKFLEKLENKKK